MIESRNCKQGRSVSCELECVCVERERQRARERDMKGNVVIDLTLNIFNQFIIKETPVLIILESYITTYTHIRYRI